MCLYTYTEYVYIYDNVHVLSLTLFLSASVFLSLFLSLCLFCLSVSLCHIHKRTQSQSQVPYANGKPSDSPIQANICSSQLLVTHFLISWWRTGWLGRLSLGLEKSILPVDSPKFWGWNLSWIPAPCSCLDTLALRAPSPLHSREGS